MNRPLVSLIAALFMGVYATALTAQTTRPAVSHVPSATVLVLPIAPPPEGGFAWIGKAIQQDLLADLTQTTRAHVLAPPDAKPAVDEREALQAARNAGAGFVVYGHSQVSNFQLRVTGQVLDVQAGSPLGAIKATAPTTDLFPLEDSLAMQAARALPKPLLTASAAQTRPSVPPRLYGVEPLYQPVPTYTPNTYSAPYYSYTEPLPEPYYNSNYYYPYSYPYWGDYWWWGPGVVFFDFDRHHHDHDFDDHHFSGHPLIGGPFRPALGNPGSVGGAGHFEGGGHVVGGAGHADGGGHAGGGGHR